MGNTRIISGHFTIKNMSSWVTVFHFLPFLRFAKGAPLSSAPLCSTVKIDGLVKSLKIHFSVIPAKAGIQYFWIVINSLDSGFHRSDDFLRNHQDCRPKNKISVGLSGRKISKSGNVQYRGGYFQINLRLGGNPPWWGVFRKAKRVKSFSYSQYPMAHRRISLSQIIKWFHFLAGKDLSPYPPFRYFQGQYNISFFAF